MKKINLIYFIYFLSHFVFAQTTATPLTFSPLTPTTFQLTNNSTATVQYVVSNKSSKTHRFMMAPLTGISQITSPSYCPNPFVLATNKSCILTLQIHGNQMSSQPILGPQICQQGTNGQPNPLQCYQPSEADLLKVTSKGTQLPTLYAGLLNGSIYYSLNNGLTWIALISPSLGSTINSMYVTSTTVYVGAANGAVYSSSNNGSSWSLIANPAPGFSVNGVTVFNTSLYIASANGTVFICTLNGSNCHATAAPALNNAVNGVFAASNALYAASANGHVYYSINNGVSWQAINGQPDGSSVNTVYVTTNTLYVGTANEYVYTSTSLTGGGTWTPYAQTVYSLCAAASGSIIAGTQGGYLFSLSSGDQLGFITYNPITSVFLLE